MSSFKADSLEIRVLETVRDHYPITVDELGKRLKVSKARLGLALKRLEKAGYIEYDILPDKVFIRLRVVPTGPKARRSAKRKRRRDSGGTTDDFSYM